VGKKKKKKKTNSNNGNRFTSSAEQQKIASEISGGLQSAITTNVVRQESPEPENKQDLLSRLQSLLEQLQAESNQVGGFASLTRNLVEEFKRIAESLIGEHRASTIEAGEIVRRQALLAVAEQKRDEGFARERAELDSQLIERRAEANAALEFQIAELRQLRLSEIDELVRLEEARSRERMQSERDAWEAEYSCQRASLSALMSEVERQAGINDALQSDLERRRVEFERLELDHEESVSRITTQMQRRREKLDQEVAAASAEEVARLQSLLEASQEVNGRLLQSIRKHEEGLESFKLLQQQLGGREPSSVINELRTLGEIVARQREELATRPYEEVRARFEDLDRERQSLMNRISELSQMLQQKELLASQSLELKNRNIELEAVKSSLEQRAKIFQDQADTAMAEIQRLRSAYERPAEIEARYREIEEPRWSFNEVSRETSTDISESEWLSSIIGRCDSYGLSFNPRIVKAFHTSLKTAEWSPLTVLAGVSGTGKSELPRLYSHFGGLYYEPLSVQPNWDSQESMLGYFNSIDNRFDAQPVLRFLAQSQKSWTEEKPGAPGYPGLRDRLCLVLLDEMNLAHPELYFAEFLSKLELRRGKKGQDVPSLPVKIGAGMKPYDLKLGRNVLWTGTMNQDETTKSLSDKVLDRSVIIYFPRPTDLKSRRKLTPLDDDNRGADLPIKTWQKWLSQESGFSDEEIQPYKSFIETMNAALEVAGRAIGHRVWQSIEYYMANYPDVRNASDNGTKKRGMHIAFEDQLVQKVMPKLRGIDTRGRSRDECLDKIRAQIVDGVNGDGFNIAKDFDLACELGYGQFIWQSANYLRDEVHEVTASPNASE
jgi:hypothetical protein